MQQVCGASLVVDLLVICVIIVYCYGDEDGCRDGALISGNSVNIANEYDGCGDLV